MSPKIKNEKALAHFLMVLLVLSWGLEYVFAKHALEALDPITLIFFKYIPASVMILIFKLVLDRDFRVHKRDLLMFALCALLGEILYFSCEYSAMDYMPVSLITILLSFVPVVSILIERIAFKKKPSRRMIIFICICIAGVVLIIGTDIRSIMSGRLIGYLFCFGAIMVWNAYNYLTAYMGDKYSDITMTFWQMVFTLVLSAPYAATHWPAASQLTPSVLWGVAYLGFISAGLGFYVFVYGLTKLGPTTNAVYSDFLPVTATLFSWLFLGEKIGAVQILGGIIVIVSGYIVIKEKSRMDSREQYADKERRNQYANQENR